MSKHINKKCSSMFKCVLFFLHHYYHSYDSILYTDVGYHFQCLYSLLPAPYQKYLANNMYVTILVIPTTNVGFWHSFGLRVDKSNCMNRNNSNNRKLLLTIHCCCYCCRDAYDDLSRQNNTSSCSFAVQKYYSLHFRFIFIYLFLTLFSHMLNPDLPLSLSIHSIPFFLTRLFILMFIYKQRRILSHMHSWNGKLYCVFFISDMILMRRFSLYRLFGRLVD